jgi:peptidoglycan hydrolase CwlO-like protein
MDRHDQPMELATLLKLFAHTLIAGNQQVKDLLDRLMLLCDEHCRQREHDKAALKQAQAEAAAGWEAEHAARAAASAAQENARAQQARAEAAIAARDRSRSRSASWPEPSCNVTSTSSTSMISLTAPRNTSTPTGGRAEKVPRKRDAREHDHELEDEE